MTAYHVAPADHEGALLSLYKQHGDEAFKMYASRWPESGNMGEYHAMYVHLHSNLDEATKYASEFGGKVYVVDCERMAEDFIKIEMDSLEYNHPMVRDEIPAEYISSL